MIDTLRTERLDYDRRRGGVGLWLRDSATGEFTFIEENSETSLSKDAISYFQTGYRMYKRGLLRSFQKDPHEVEAK